ncbi:MAG: hypothetical protein PF795_08980 [Kiritimatiellae bacterium]|nr:hypothetical protein [Kiritimatiellia bacterium]
MKSCLILILCVLSPLFAQPMVTGLVKQHDDRAKTFEERPFGKDDISYGLYVDFYEGLGAWRLGASYASGLSGAGEADSVITPELTLLATDGMWETGISVLIDYIDTEEEADWGDVYYQIQLGLSLPVTQRVQIGVHAFYPFASFSDITDIRVGDLDYGLLLRFKL